MKSTTAIVLLISGTVITALTGCQAGKAPFANLAWWKKDDALATEYIQPPSHQFTPSETSVASNTDDANLPPLPPDIEKTVDTFERDIAQSYRELAKQSSTEANEIQQDIAEQTRQALQAKMDQAKEQQHKLVQTKNEVLNVASNRTNRTPPSRTPSSSDFANPLTPRASDRFGQSTQPPLQPRRNSTVSTSPSSGTGSSGFVPQSPSSGFIPKSESRSNSTPGYEQLANQTLQPAKPVAVEQPKKQSGKFSPGNSGFNPGLPVVKTNSNNGTGFSPSSMKSNSTAAKTPGAFQSAAPPAAQVNFEYPETPYSAFQPRQDESKDDGASKNPDTILPPPGTFESARNRMLDNAAKKVDNVVDASKDVASGFKSAASSASSPSTSNAGGGMTLNLQGQSAYAPGSVRRPNEINPNDLVLPMKDFSTKK